MTSEQFTYWLQGYAELAEGAPTAEQWQMIRDHLQLVFDKVTPEYRFTPGQVGPFTELRSSCIAGGQETRAVC